MKKYYLLLLLSFTAQADLLNLSNPADMAGKQGSIIYTSASEFLADDFTAVKGISGNWSGVYTPKSGTNMALGIARAEAGITYDSWRLAGIYRAEELIDANRDMITMIYDNKQHITVPAGQTFNANMHIEGFAAKGLRLDKGYKVVMSDNADLSLGAGFSLLQGNRVRIANANGTASSTSSGYQYDAQVNDSYSRATYPFIVPGTPYGNGYALDLGAKVNWKNGAHLDFTANDILGRMNWHNMPNTVETANSATLARDASGYIYYNPTISGKNAINRLSIVQRLPVKTSMQFTYPSGDFELFAGTSYMSGFWFPQLGTTYRINGDWKTSLDYDTRFKTIGFGIQNKYLRLNLRSSATAIGNANAYGFTAELRIPL